MKEAINYYYQYARECHKFIGGDSILEQCIEKYLDTSAIKNGMVGSHVKYHCGDISKEEKNFFDNIIFPLLLDEEYFNRSELYIILEEFSELVGMKSEEISNLLRNFTLIQVKIKDEKDGSFMISSLFTAYQSGRCFNFSKGKHDSDDHYCALNLNPAFFQVCAELRSTMNANA